MRYWMSTPSTVAMIAALASGLPWSATAHRWDIYERNAFDVKERSVSFVRVISERGAADLRARMPALNGRVAHLRLGIASRARRAVALRRRISHRVPGGARRGQGPRGAARCPRPAARMGVPVRCTLYGTGPLQDELEARPPRSNCATRWSSPDSFRKAGCTTSIAPAASRRSCFRAAAPARR